MDPVHTGAGKTGRNEALKLRAGWFNTVSAAFFIGALIQPGLVVVQQQRDITVAEMVVSAIFLGISRMLFLRAQRIAREMED